MCGIKLCKQCGKEFLINKDNFGKNKNSKSGFLGTCRTCVKRRRVDNKAYAIQYRIDNKEAIKEYRKSNIEYAKEYYETNKEAIIEYNKTYYNKNKDRLSKEQKLYRENNKEAKAIYYKNNKEVIKMHNKIYKENNKEITAKRMNEYQKNNRNKFNISNQKRRAGKKLLPNNLTSIQWYEIKTMFNNKCAYCGEDKLLAQEHLIALSKGGEYTVNNIIPSCKSCNSSKGDKDFFIWYKEYKYYDKKREFKILKHLHYNGEEQQLMLTV